MAELCLSRDEVAALCRSPQRARQELFLRKNGIKHYLDVHGWPVVLRSAIDPTEKKTAIVAAWSPNKAA
ncbi:DUF4224 domain-containing protein [Xanthomonas sp. NCPPB 1638]|uniref:DUF4224 domain-containing protein n=1 Tax=Xanthomonas TaxID=338 RepID=UPI00132EC8F4|nr:DUF4224 domain-containing protein [Xanthomonas cucurbitae]QHG87980.1 DUF4224 domain-containing protein [Xanthomonas cucurbitae]